MIFIIYVKIVPQKGENLYEFMQKRDIGKLSVAKGYALTKTIIERRKYSES